MANIQLFDLRNRGFDVLPQQPQSQADTLVLTITATALIGLAIAALAKGKKLHDKRETLKKRDWGREKGRLLRARG